ncbi:hypothetical protein NUM_43440 [Actinocatenispora comari]|uniref:Uncharacterized protein n=1 Tax=Actinocatenispora comari TaxID=2807577 RepID=A0A8J4AGE9_9ACTN|nr:hypothetical protein NUM_43440 [Actinocatenispora comari]
MSYPLALRLVAIYSRRRNTIHDATADATIAAAAATLSRAYRTRPDPAATPAELVITTHTPATGPAGTSLAELATQVSDGGCLVVVVPADRGHDRSTVLTDIAAAGLMPLHCIQAITDPAGVTGDRFTYHTPDRDPGTAADPTAVTHCWLVIATAPHLEGGIDA